MTRLLLALASMVALLLPPAPASADACFARLAETGLVYLRNLGIGTPVSVVTTE